MVQSVPVPLATEHRWVGLVIAAALAPIPVVLVVLARKAWLANDERRVHLAVGAACYALLTLGIAIGAYSSIAGGVFVGVGVLGLVGRGVITVRKHRR
ncbi:MAG: hypothetical protein JWO37_422 [Acidimicrobiales bacterium]|jgi:predicted anti-sigma-YlaC factor YlaD|nr:hypothetical protein [Acidimicrobiales bacterium]